MWKKTTHLCYSFLPLLFQTLATTYRQLRITHNSEKDDVNRLGLFGGHAGPTQNTP